MEKTAKQRNRAEMSKPEFCPDKEMVEKNDFYYKGQGKLCLIMTLMGSHVHTFCLARS